jgi:hypothetical protein
VNALGKANIFAFQNIFCAQSTLSEYFGRGQ